MKNDIQRILESLTPCGAPADLRGRVLESVARELPVIRRSPTRRARWDLRIAMAVAASLILGVVLNIGAIRSDDARQARLYGPDPLPREIRRTVEIAEQVAGPECAEWVRQRLVSARQSGRGGDPPAIDRYHQQLMQLAMTERRFNHAEKDPQVDRHRLGRPDRSALDCQRRFRVS